MILAWQINIRLCFIIKILAQKIDFIYNSLEVLKMNYVVATGPYSKEKYNMHKHNDYEIIFYPSGSGTIDIVGNKFSVKKGCIVIMPPNTMHGSISHEGLCYISIIGNKDGLIRVNSPIILGDNEKGEGASLIQMILENRYNDTDYENALCLAYVLFVMKNVNINSDIEKAVQKIKMAISTNFYDTSLDVTAILNDSGYAEDYIRAIFRKTLGKTPIAFLNEVRITNAKTLIKLYRNAMSLSEIALSCGFVDYAYFSRKFKMLTGVSPVKYKDASSEAK